MSTVILEKIDILENLFRQYEITGKELAKVKRLANKLRKKDITVSVIGQFKRGKSTLVNSILQEKIMPVGIVPVTAVITSVRYGEKSAKVHFENGMIEEVAFEEMSKYVNEQENKDNVLGVSQVEITVPSEFLKTGITLVDTPGVGSVHQKNTDAAYAFVKESDAVIFMLSVDSPINQIEIAFLEKTKEFASKFYFVVNKADIVEADELEDYLVYCKNLIRSLMGIEEISLFPVSAKKETGLEPLKENIVKDCEEKGTEIMEEAALLKLRDIVESALRQISLYRAAMNLSAEDFKEKLDALETYCQGIKAEARQNCDRIITSPAYMEGQLNRIKNHLSHKVSELFGMDYYYDIEEIEMKTENQEEKTAEDFIAQEDEICDTLQETLYTIFLYREENAYKVVRRINDLNKLVRSLVKMRGDLEKL